MNASFHQDLHRELTEVGITGSLRGRILSEFDEHLLSDPQADLGPPPMLARQFANELGTSRARRAAFSAFAALAVAGILFAVMFLIPPDNPMLGALPKGVGWPARVANWLGVLAPQIAFAAGMLAALRGFHRRREVVITGAEARIMLRRAAVGAVAGVLSMASLFVLAVELGHAQPGWWRTLAEIFAVVGCAGLLATVPALLAARRLPPLATGSAGDIYDDVGPWLPQMLRIRPWRVAWTLAAVIFLLLAVTGFMADDGPDGVARGIIDAAACLIGFGTIGRYLGLWSPAAAEPPAAELAES